MAQTPRFLESPLGALATEIENTPAPALQPVDQTIKGPDWASTPEPSAPRASGKIQGELPQNKALFSAFESAALKYKVPVNILMALAQQESGYDPMAVGAPTQWGRAKGLMQNLDSTARGLGINPFDPVAAIDGAARQYADRIAKGYSPEDAIKAHFGGDNRQLWGPKTRQYLADVMQRAGDIGREYSGLHAFDQVTSSAETHAAAPAPAPADDGKGFLATAWDTAKDVAHGLKVGLNTAAADADELVGRIPVVGKPIQRGMDSADRFMHGLLPSLWVDPGQEGTSQAGLKRDTEAQVKAMTPQMQAALNKHWVNEDDKGNYSPGAAWSDWRSYLGGITQSLPEQALTMIPAARLAKAAYAFRIGAGASEAVAAKTAAKVAMAAGAVGEGALGGAQSSREVRDDIMELPQQTLDKSDAYQGLLAQGMSPSAARKQLAEDGSTKAFLLGGIATGVFGGFGDRTLARIITKKASSSTIRSILGDAGREAVSEGLLEELPQSALQQTAQNYAEQQANPDKRLSEGVADQAIGGAVLGGLQGGAMGGIAGARGGHGTAAPQQAGASPAPAPAEPAAEVPPAAPSAPRDDAVVPGGTIGRAVASGVEAARQAGIQAGLSSEVPPRVTAKTPLEGDVPGTLERYEPDGKGGWSAMILGDDGQVRRYTHQDGVELTGLPEGMEGRTQEQQREEEKAQAADKPRDQPTPPPAPAQAEGVVDGGVPTMVTQAMRKQLRERGFTAEQIGKMKPAEAHQHLQKPAAAPEQITPEPASDTRAQIEAIRDPSSGKDAALITPNTAIPDDINWDGLESVPTKQGWFITSNPEKAAAARHAGDNLTTEQVGELLGYTSRKDQTDGTVVQARDADGNVVHQEATSQAGAAKAAERAASMAPAGGSVETTTAPQALAERAERVDADTQRNLRLRTGDRKVTFPDAAHAALYDFGSQRATNRASGTSLPDARMRELTAERSAHLAEQIGIDPSEIPAAADRYRASVIKQARESDGDVAAPAIEKGVASGQPSNRERIGAVDDGRAPGAGAGATNEVGESAAGPRDGSDAAGGRAGAEAPVPASGSDVAPAGAAGKPSDAVKWFGTREKADAYIAKQKIADSHEVVENGRRFEVREKAAADAPSVDRTDKAAARAAAIEYLRWSRDQGRMMLNQVSPGIHNGRTFGVNDGIARNAGKVIVDNLHSFPAKELWDQATAKSEAEPGKSSTAESSGESNQDGRFANNKLFAADKVEAARARLRSKLSQLNSGFDPEVMLDGITIAGAYIEAGVRAFPEYAKAMTADLGKAIRPYLLSFYEGARHYPGLETDGMTEAAEAARMHAKLMEVSPAKTDAVGQVVAAPEQRKKAAPSGAGRTMRQDWGVSHIDGHTPLPGGKNQQTDDGLKGGVKDAFLADAKGYLREVAAQLEAAGFTPYPGRGSKKPSAITVNEAGPGVSGDVTLTMQGPNGHGVYATVGASAMRGGVPASASGISLMFRTTKNGDRYGGRSNQWARPDLTAGELAETIKQAVERDAGSKANAGDQVSAAQGPAAARAESVRADAGGRNAGSDAERAGGAARAEPGRRDGDGDRSAESAGQPGVSAGPGEAGAGVRADADGGAGNRAESGDRANRRPLGDYRYQPGELTRDGSWKHVAERNVQAVELVKKLEAEKRMATPDERALLARFTGWGASEIANGVFPDPRTGRFKDGWQELGDRLRAALGDSEYAAARRSTQYAHYTSEKVIRSIYGALQRMGFGGGRVLEPGMGIGLFKGLMPGAMAEQTQYHGIEFDPMTAAIAKALYPQSNVQHGDFTETSLPKDYYDAAIGNPPFSSTKVTNDPEYRSKAFMLHDYFFAKTMDRVKPGGLVVFVTSKGTMDKANSRARQYLADRANLVGAIRLPQTAFKDNAGTEVVTDVLFLQKRGSGIEDNGVRWSGTGSVRTPQGTATINEYFVAHPEMVLGDHAMTGSMYRANDYTVTPRAGDIEAQFADAVSKLPEGIYRPDRGSQAERAAVVDRDFNPNVKKEGSVYLDDKGDLRIVDQGSGVPLTERLNSAGKAVPLKPKEVQFLKDYAGLRDALKQTQLDQLTDGNWEASLAALNAAYQAFTKAHGPVLAHSITERDNPDGTTTVITRWKNNGLLRLDAENALVRALEEVRPDGTIVPSKLLTGRTLNKPTQPKIETVQDALLVSLNGTGRLDIGNVAKLAGLSERESIEQLGDAIYHDPSSGWTTADAYLSGNVVRKLKEARSAAKSDPSLRRNVAALEAVQPAPLAPADISAQLGAHWVPPSDVAAFASEVLGEKMKVSYSPLAKAWAVEREGAKQVSEWNPEGSSADDLLERTLNNKQIKVTRREPNGAGGWVTVVDPVATEAANSAAKKMNEQFKRWLWASPQRAERLSRFYNEHFNNIVPRSFDGQHLTLPGVSSRFNLYPHQKRAIWRAIQDGNTYFAHSVGAGKTFTMIASAMEERRLGLSKRPMMTVPNHMLAQFAREAQELYPTAHIMVADEDAFHTSVRQQFVARAALNDPDLIIITHSAFSRIGMSPEFSDRYVQDQIDHYMAIKDEVDSGDRVTVKQIERRIEQLENRLSGKTDQSKKDRALTFEELGVDRLFVDEFHEFRKLDFATNRGNVKGIDPSGSQRAMDLHMKVQYLEGKNPGRSLVAASGTPVTNTMGELFTAQRFMQPHQLEEDGLDSFDAWANQFGEVVDGFEQNASGGYEVVSRFAKFVNVPDLMRRVRSFMDILTSEQLGDLVQRPAVEGGGRDIIVTPSPDGYKAFQKSLEQRIKAIRNRRGPPKPGDDIILSVIGDGRFSAIDMRFVDPELPSDPNSKLNRMLDDAIRSYHDTADWQFHTNGQPDELPGGASMIFTDLGLGEQSAKSRGFDMKDWITKRLIDGGVDPAHIAFMRDHKQHGKKERLFADMRQGKKRILIGGKDMETGVNAQKRLTDLFHLDAPWFPASVEQREGRIIRQGNQNRSVRIRAYATKGSYDSTMWGMNARKQRFITQALQGSDSVRSMEDVSEASSFEMASALASGDERYLKLAGLRSDVERLGRLFSAHERQQRDMRSEQLSVAAGVRVRQELATQLQDAISKRKDIAGDKFSATVDGAPITDREDFGNALVTTFKELADSHKLGEQVIGRIGGFNIVYGGVELKGSGDFLATADLSIPGDPDPLLSYPLDPQMSIKGLAARAANQLTGMDRELARTTGKIAELQRRAEQLESRVGASFPELAELTEKQQALTELEAELSTETAQLDQAQDAAASAEQAPEGPESPEQYQDIADSDVPMAAGSPVPEPRRVRTLARLKKLRSEYQAGRIDEARYVEEVSALTDAIDQRNDDRDLQKFIAGRVRGADWLRERLIRARRTGELPEEVSDFALWLLDQNPNVANDLGISIREGGEGSSAGQYSPQERVATIFADNTNHDTAVHEILHHTERMMPEDVQEGIIREHRRAWEGAYRKATPAVKEALADMAQASVGDRAAYARVIEAFRDGRLDYQTHYPLVNPSEYWAVNATDILAGRHRVRGSWIGKARQWIRELMEKAKGLFGLRSDAPILRGLQRVLNGTGERLSPQMLAERAAGRQASYSGITGEEGDGASTPVSTVAAEPAEEVRTSRDVLTSGPLGEPIQRLIDKGAVQFHDDAPAGAPAGTSAWTDRDGTIHLMNSLPAAAALPVLLHEAFHGRVEPLVGTEAWNGLLGNLDQLYQRAARGENGMGEFFQRAAERVAAAQQQGDPNLAVGALPDMTAQEFGAYAIEEYESAPAVVKSWVSRVIGQIKAWLLRRFGKQLGAITPAQLNALARAALDDGGQAERKIASSFPDARMYSAEQRREALENAIADTDANRPAPDWRGRLARDISRVRNFFHHPRHIAAIFHEFTPVYQTAMDQGSMRDNIITEMNRDYQHYAALPQEGKERVNAVLELGRLIGDVFTPEQLAHGVTNPGFRMATRYDENGNAVRYRMPLNAAASATGEVVKLNPDEVQAYGSLRAMFDHALDMFADQAVEEMGFPELRGRRQDIVQLSRQMAEEGGDTSRLSSAAKFIADIEQAKRQGYVPFSRYGDYVVAVKRDKAKLTYVRQQSGGYVVRGVPTDMDGFMESIGATPNQLEGGWNVTAAQRKQLNDENSQTVYAEKIETGLRDMLPEARAKWLMGKARDIPAVAKAYERIKAQWAPEGSSNYVLEPFAVDKKRPDEGVKLADLDTLAGTAALDFETWSEVREKLQDAIQAQGFRKHFFSADNVPGYSKDFERSITDYMGSMSGYLARREHQKRWDNAIKGIRAERLHQYATRYRDYVNSPGEEFAMLRQAGFLTYIAGSVASGVTNLTQLPIMTFPALAQFANGARVAAEMARASKDVAKMFKISRNVGLDMFDPEKAPADVRDDLVKAWHSGDFIPQATFEILATANQRNVGARRARRVFEKAAQVFGLTFSVPERINRLTTYIAAHRLAQLPGARERVAAIYGKNALAQDAVLKEWSPAAFAEYMVDETQFRMGKTNRPTLMRGIGAPLLQFKGFAWQSLEAWSRMVRMQGKRGAMAAALSIATIIALSGTWGFPGADDARKLLETTLKWLLDRDIDLRTALRRGAYEATGSKWIAQAVDRGAPFASGLDMGRVGLGNLAPQSAELTDMLGIPYDLLIKRPVAALNQLRNGSVLGALGAVAPKAFGNALQAVAMAKEGYRDTKGNMIMTPEQISSGDIVQKALGWTPTDLTNLRDYRYAQYRQSNATSEYQTRVADNIARTLGLMGRAKDADTRAELQEQLRDTMKDISDFNRGLAPDQQVHVSPAMIKNRMRQEQMGAKGKFGTERKAARGSASELRDLFDVN